MNKHLTYIILASLSLTACNKDDVIESGKESNDGFRPATSQSSPYQNKVYDYTPAPGQFINETVTGGFTGEETSIQKALLYAEKRLEEQKFVSLGAFGGYIVVGFDHSIANTESNYDFAILSNATESSNEPGIVWVMQDVNRNGLPDDEWYELKGSETGKESTVSSYSVTYYRPEEPNQAVRWTDSEGNSGAVEYLKNYHKQDYYYPVWIAAQSYTLTGTKLPAQNFQDTTSGNWLNPPYEWGYVDNMGKDALADSPQWVGFKISNAIDAQGKKVALEYIDYVKVQQSVQAQSGWIGENSCEVLSFADYSLMVSKNIPF